MTALDTDPESAGTFQLADLIDVDTYPIDRPDSGGYRAAVEAARVQLRGDGCAIIKDLVRPEALRIMSDEIVERKPTTHFSTQTINPYFHTDHNDDFPHHHPVNTFLERSSGFIPGDSWDSGCATDVIFRSPELARFLAECLEIPELHCYADPLAGLTANILDPGSSSPGTSTPTSSPLRFWSTRPTKVACSSTCPTFATMRMRDLITSNTYWKAAATAWSRSTFVLVIYRSSVAATRFIKSAEWASTPNLVMPRSSPTPSSPA